MRNCSASLRISNPTALPHQSVNKWQRGLDAWAVLAGPVARIQFVRAAAHGGDDRRDGHPAPVAGMQHLGRGERRRGRSGQVAERHRLGGDELAGQVVPADLGVRDDASVRRRDLHDGLAVRPGCSDPHREIGPGQIEGLGEVVKDANTGEPTGMIRNAYGVLMGVPGEGDSLSTEEKRAAVKKLFARYKSQFRGRSKDMDRRSDPTGA
jgi:hypothetical protein